MEKVCKVTGKRFVISPAEEKYCTDRGLPLATIEPLTLLRRLQAFRNRVHLYNAVCASSGKAILSCFPPEKGYKVFDSGIWNGDSWNGQEYGRDYDPTRPFFEQFDALLHSVPLPNLSIVDTGESNSKYVNGAQNLRNCYLCFTTLVCEDSMFCWNVFSSKNVLDVVYCMACELCYDSIDLESCYHVMYSESSNHCSDSAFLYNCQACKHCFGCVNLNNKEYCWYNEQLTKEEYENRLAKLTMTSYQVIATEKKKFAEFRKQFPIKYYKGKSNENITGNYLLNNKNCNNCFLTNNSQDLENCVIAIRAKDCFGVFSSVDSELVYHSVTGKNYNNQFCLECFHGQNLMFCMYCINNCSDNFGCVGLKKSQYCILNKQYSKDEYERLVAVIKKNMIERGEWQDFFPQSLSPFYYNQSDASTFFPLEKAEALAAGFTWADETVAAESQSEIAPDDAALVSDAVLQKTFLCQLTRKPYRITKQELDFYRQMQVPIPRVAPIERILNRAKVLAVKPLASVPCHQCQQELQTIFDPQVQPILCEQCYQQQF